MNEAVIGWNDGTIDLHSNMDFFEPFITLRLLSFDT
jgi:hypothetical protein